MKPTKSQEIREHVVAHGAPEMSSLELALQGPMIDDFSDHSATAKPAKKLSVGGFLKKKFGLIKGMCIFDV
ncbi:hypothetical protein EB796_000958 [Bugula neritina]|uniref:Uncharacterized protein n=1 Tax=Bugula neritina TaxID=10212 RepID=A0A7J7KRM6_BUGNE|nr:hypothetical protein EB796_000958 [Bugula neritina]